MSTPAGHHNFNPQYEKWGDMAKREMVLRTLIAKKIINFQKICLVVWSIGRNMPHSANNYGIIAVHSYLVTYMPRNIYT